MIVLIHNASNYFTTVCGHWFVGYITRGAFCAESPVRVNGFMENRQLNFRLLNSPLGDGGTI